MYFFMFISIVSPICTAFIMKPPLETGYGVYVRACVCEHVFVCVFLYVMIDRGYA